MSENTTTDLTIKVPDDGVTTKTFQQFGMRYPDGTIKWVSDPDVRSFSFKGLADGDKWDIEKWQDALRRRANEAKINHIEYAAGHQLIKRTAILAVTEHEEV